MSELIENNLKIEEIIDLIKKKDKNKEERDLVCNYCVWAYGDNQCVSNENCKSPELTEFKPNWIWKLIKTPAITTIKDINGNVEEFEYTIFDIEETN